MTWSAFRPSGDKSKYGFNVPVNILVMLSLDYLHEIFQMVYQDFTLSKIATLVKEQIQSGITKYGMEDVHQFGKVFIYETNGRDKVSNLIVSLIIRNLLTMVQYLVYFLFVTCIRTEF